MIAIDLAGATALVTGAGQGVGREIARTLASAGAVVLVNDIQADRAEEVVAEIAAAGGSGRAAVFDVTDWTTVQAAIEAAGGVDIVVNNAGNSGAGSFQLKPVAESDPADWEPFLRVNLYGAMYCTRAALPSMISRGTGRIITVISDTARLGEPQMAAYSAAKAGAAGFMRSVAAEVGRYGITSNCLSLGTMRTPMAGLDRETQDPEGIRKLLRGYAIRRRGEPADVGGAVAFLASPMASWITGQTIPINGGRSMAL